MIQLAVLDGVPTARLLAQPSGQAVLGRVVRDHVIDINDLVAPDITPVEEAYARTLPYVEPTLAPVGLVIRADGVTELSLRPSNYARFAAASDAIKSIDPQLWLQTVSRTRLGTPVSLSHSLGVNCTLETSDGKLIWTRRSATSRSGAEALNVALSEGATPFDLDGYEWRPEVTARRGLTEELGFPSFYDVALDMQFHSLVCQLDDGGISLLGHVRTHLTADEVLKAARNADDHLEITGPPTVTDATPDAIAELLRNNPISWTAWSAASILGLLATRFGGAQIDGLGWNFYESAEEEISA